MGESRTVRGPDVDRRGLGKVTELTPAEAARIEAQEREFEAQVDDEAAELADSRGPEWTSEGRKTVEWFTPNGKRVLVLPREARTEYGEGKVKIALPTQALRPPAEGTIIALGSEVTAPAILEAMGDPDARVLYGEFSGFRVTLNGLVHLALYEDDIIGVYRERPIVPEVTGDE